MKEKVYIGLRFKPKRKNSSIHTVIDIHTVTNAKGELVRKEIITSHQFAGQEVKTVTPLSTISLSEIV